MAKSLSPAGSKWKTERIPITRDLSELEGAVLGHVWANGPCTAYFIRKIFLDSPSPYWSGSAGAIYPLVKRLERHGLIRSSDSMTGRRRSKGYVLTAPGRKCLQGWLRRLEELVVGAPPDPLRTRIEFLAALPSAQRAAFIAHAATRLQSHLREIEGHCEEQRLTSNQYSYLAVRGSLLMVQARVKWLDEISRELDQGKQFLGTVC